jgi:hypothetical protein
MEEWRTNKTRFGNETDHFSDMRVMRSGSVTPPIKSHKPTRKTDRATEHRCPEAMPGCTFRAKTAVYLWAAQPKL